MNLSELQFKPSHAVPVAGVVLDPMLDLPEVLPIVKAGKTAWYTAIKEGRAPAPYRVGARRVAWKASEIKAYLDALQRVEAPAGAAQ